MSDIGTVLRTLLANGRFQEFLAMELLAHDSAAGTVTIKLPWKPEFERGPGTEQWHGGLIEIGRAHV